MSPLVLRILHFVRCNYLSNYMEIGIKQAKIDLSKLIHRVHNGEQVFITNNGEVVAELKAVRKSKYPDRGYGMWKDRFKDLPDDWWGTPEADAQVLSLFDWNKEV